MHSVLDHYNPSPPTQFSQQEWQGLRSSKFPKTKSFLPKRDLISSNFDIPNQTAHSGRKHFAQSQQRSPQYTRRSIVKLVPECSPHWCLRPSGKKTFTQSFTQSHQRRERGHQIPEFPVTSRESAGIRTFYNLRIRDGKEGRDGLRGRGREGNVREYSVEDRMQRKVRVDQGELRKTFFLREGERFCL